MNFDPDKIANLNYPTPYFLFSPEVIKKTVQLYKDNLPQAEIFYAVKSNADLEVLRAIMDAGCGFEVASTYELSFLKELGVPAERIIYGTSVKPAAHVQDFVAYGVDRFALDSEQEIDMLAKLAPGARVYARATVDDSKSVFTMSAKFGVEPAQAAALLVHAKAKGLVPYGLSFNVGSQALDPEAWSKAIKELIPAIKQLEEQGIKLEVLNLGGGYPNHYVEGDKAVSPEEFLKPINEALNLLPYQMKIIIEPGRGLVARSMVLVTSVFAKLKRSKGHWLFLDAGAYNALLEAMAYQGSIRYSITPLLKAGADTAAKEEFVLTGPTGDSLDVIDHAALLPSSIDVGDKLIIHDAGAYSLVLTTPFNGFPKPPVYKLG